MAVFFSILVLIIPYTIDLKHTKMGESMYIIIFIETFVCCQFVTYQTGKSIHMYTYVHTIIHLYVGSPIILDELEYTL